MTYSINIRGYKLIFSDTMFADYRKKPTISVYDEETNTNIKIASFNSKETFEWFIKFMGGANEADRQEEDSKNEDKTLDK